MRKLILSMMITLDGAIARPDGDLEWFRSDEDFETEMLGLLSSVDAMLFGRISYQLLSAYWPTAGTATAADAPGGFSSSAVAVEFARLMNSIPKIVFSRTLAKADWGPVTVIRDNIADEIQSMKQTPGKDLVLFAGASIASSFINLDLFDEYRLMVHPIVLGRGIPLFQNLQAERELTLVKATPFRSEVVLLRYRRARSGVKKA